METIYWITRLDGIFTLFCILMSFSGAAVLAFIFIGSIKSAESNDNSHWKWCKKGIIVSSILFLISLFGYILTPTTKEALVIYGVGGAIDYIKNDSVATNIPHKAFVTIDKFLDEYNNKPDHTK